MVGRCRGALGATTINRNLQFIDKRPLIIFLTRPCLHATALPPLMQKHLQCTAGRCGGCVE